MPGWWFWKEGGREGGSGGFGRREEGVCAAAIHSLTISYTLSLSHTQKAADGTRGEEDQFLFSFTDDEEEEEEGLEEGEAESEDQGEEEGEEEGEKLEEERGEEVAKEEQGSAVTER